MLAVLAATMAILEPSAPPQPMREFRAAWIATVDNIDWPSKPGLSVKEMKRELLAILDTCQKLNMNAVVLQVRPSADALYKSPHEPWAWYLTGEQGRAPAENFDPLEFACYQAHLRGMELHAWLNPYRALHPAQKGPVSNSHVSKKFPRAVKKYGSYLWMDPGDPDVQKHSFLVFMDLVERYNLDGIHIDDYFYPYPVAGQDFPDDESYQSYRSNGGTLGRKDWRRHNVNTMIEDVYEGIKKRKPYVKFGISPFGIARPGVPSGIKAGIDQYDDLYADCELWLEEGWCDYMSPQLYWPIKQEAQSFPRLLDWWTSVNPHDRHIWPGLYTSQLNPNGSAKWKPAEVANQIALTRKSKSTPGAIHFSVKAIHRDWAGIKASLGKTYAQKALVPESAWLGDDKPGKPSIATFKGGRMKVNGLPGAQFIAIYDLKGKLIKIAPNNSSMLQFAGTVRSVVVQGVSRTGVLGPAVTVPLSP